MPIEIQVHAVPHLFKALVKDKVEWWGQEHAGTFHCVRTSVMNDKKMRPHLKKYILLRAIEES